MLLENTYWPESDDPYSYFDDARPERNILTPGNRQVAREVAAHSFVLLKNDTVQQLEGPGLPLKKSGTIALVGPLADNFHIYQYFPMWENLGNNS